MVINKHYNTYDNTHDMHVIVNNSQTTPICVH